MRITTLIVEDDEGLRSSLETSFRRQSHEVLGAETLAQARDLLRKRKIDLILLDIRLPDGSGMEVLECAREIDGDTLVIMMTAFPEVKVAVRAMQTGAHDFIVKPFELQELHLTVERAIEARGLRYQVRRLEREKRGRDEACEILGDCPLIVELRHRIGLVAAADTPVLVVGETGTGKELVAESIHRLSSRSEYSMVKVNCSALSEQLLESELFGHEKGAFTDAREAHAGLFEMADGGVLFLDEISEMNPGLQAKLLRVVEGQPFRRVGGQREIRANVRIVAATNRDLPAMMRVGRFREDLYYRLNGFQIDVPPLRKRGDDIILLARFFLQRSAAAMRKEIRSLSLAAERLLLSYPWRGNVRELRNIIERSAILSEDTEVDVEHLPGELQASAFIRQEASSRRGSLPSLSDIELRYIQHVVGALGGNLSAAAKVLGVARNTLKAKIHGEES